MDYLTIPEFQKMRGERAVKALHAFIDELEERRGKEFTDKQTAALHKFAQALLASIQAEKHAPHKKPK